MAVKKKNEWVKISKKYPKIEFVRLQFAGKLEKTMWMGALSKGGIKITTDGSSVYDDEIIPRKNSDILLIPDFKTFQVVPHFEDTGMVICDSYRIPKKKEPLTPLECCSRSNLKKAIKIAENVISKLFQEIYPNHKIKKIKILVAIEPEFFLDHDLSKLSSDKKVKNGYYCEPVRGVKEQILKEVLRDLAAINIPPEMFHMEVTKKQGEIGVECAEAIALADSIMRARQIIKDVAGKYGYQVSFNPKPKKKGANGSGAHTQVNFVVTAINGKGVEEKINLFCDPAKEHGASEILWQSVAGLLKYRSETLPMTNPLKSSHDRLYDGKNSEAPSDVSWGISDRTASFSIKAIETEAIRVEDRLPDSSAEDIHMLITGVLLPMISGIEEKLKLSDSDHYKKKLPKGPEKALDLMNKSEMLRRNLGDKVVDFMFIAGHKRLRDEKEERKLTR